MSCNGLIAQKIASGQTRAYCRMCQEDMGWISPPKPRECNHHTDCDKADEESKAAGKERPFHCRIDDCEDCFGC